METMMFKILVSMWLFNGAFGLDTNKVTVEGLGNVIGTIESTCFTDRTIYSFRGIPYAQPPIGDLRFRPPVKVTEWEGNTLYATEYGTICPQPTSGGFRGIYNDEDCLTLNVYVPEVKNSDAALPVMIYLHGGTFMSGSPSKYEPSYMLEKDIILVMPNFRLGILGLLSLQTDEVPGNVQFLDQIMAMQWVQDNIGYFGGDKDRVTLFGQSSGAASVHLHLFSELSKGLFHRTILQSGTAFGTYMMDYDPVKTATKIAKLVKCNTTDTREMTTCLKALSVESIINGYDQYEASIAMDGHSGMAPNRAVIQTAGEYKFLTEDPRTLAANGQFIKLPMMGGIVQQEGSIMLNKLYYDLPNKGLINDTEFMTHDFIAVALRYLGASDPTGAVRDSMINTYFNNGQLGDFSKMLPGLIDMFSIFSFKAPVYDSLYRNSRVGQDTYLYTFDYHGKMTTLVRSFPFDSGVCHADELMYQFPLFKNLSKNDMKMVERLVQLLTSFATDGVPTADGVENWPAMSTRTGPYLRIDRKATIGFNFLDEYTVNFRKSLDSCGNSGSTLVSKRTSEYCFI